MVFCNDNMTVKTKFATFVTILILIDGFLQYSIAVYDTDILGGSQSLF